jgi:hypothetical protein
VIIEDKIRDRQAGRKFRARLCPAANELDQFPACPSPLVLPLQGASNRALTMRAVCAPGGPAERQTSASRLPRAHFAKGTSEQGSKLASQLNNMDRVSQPISSHPIRRRERAISIIKSPNSVSRMCFNSLKTNERDTLKSPKNQEMRFLHPPSPWRMVDGLSQGTAFYPELRRATVAKSAQDSGLHTLIAEATPELREINRPTIYEAGSSRCSTLLTGSGPHSETAVTYRKRTAALFLTGSRIAHSELRASAKMREETSRNR